MELYKRDALGDVGSIPRADMEGRAPMCPDDTSSIPYGYCHCGCGHKTKISPANDPRAGWIKGEPRRFLAGHQARPRTPLPDRFWSRADREGDECWLWRGRRNAHGYGVFDASEVRSGPILAHRLAYELERGPIPDGMIVCHACDTPACVRPDHLFLGTQQDNLADMDRKNRRRTGALRGAANPIAKLTEDAVRDLRDRYRAGESVSALARAFGIHRKTVADIVQGKRWAHVQ